MPFFRNFERDFGTLGRGIAKIGLQIRTRRPKIRLHANFGKFGCIISIENNQLACTGQTRLYTQHFAANRMCDKIRIQAP